MKPLFFLTFRSFVNGLKRSLTSPKRLITTAAILLYYFWWFVRPFVGSSGRFQRAGLTPRFEFPPLELLDAIVFTGFAGLSLLLALGIFSFRSTFKPADVDVLFPTPISPRFVLLFRIVRDYLATLVLPLFLILFTWKPLQVEQLFLRVPHPQSTGYALRALSLGFVLVTTAWVGIGYAVGLYVNRNDRFSESRKRNLGLGLAGVFLTVLAYCGYNAMQFQRVGDFVSFFQQGWLRAFFFTATPATKIVMGPLEGNTGETLFGAGVLVAISGISLYLALKQAPWMYDQAAVRGFGAESVRRLQQRGDVVGVAAEAARQGKGGSRRSGWFQSLNAPGFWALLWKDALIQWRSIRGLILLLMVSGLIFVLLPSVLGTSSMKADTLGYFILIMEGFLAFAIASMTSQTGFTELLRRVDLQKPLPFGSQAIVASEVLAKSLPAILIPIFCSLVGLAFTPSAWREVVAGALFYPSLAAVICALVCVIVLLFPEIDDVSQRGFRGLMLMVGLLIAGAPGVLGFVGVAALTKSTIWGALPGALINFAVAFGLTAIGGALYAAFNPSE